MANQNYKEDDKTSGGHVGTGQDEARQPKLHGKAASTLALVKHNHTIAVALAFFLIGLYTSPMLMIGYVFMVTEGFQDITFGLQWFAAFMSTSESTLSQLHKVLFPIISALSVIVFRGKVSGMMIALGLVVLVLFVVATFVGVIFDMQTTRDALDGLNIKLELPVVKAFFTRVQETLLMYFMVLFGIGVANARDSSMERSL